MYQIEEIVVEKNSGLSRIQDIREENFGGRGAVLYYVLQPFADKGATVYVPVHTAEEKIRALYTKEELDAGIGNAKERMLEWGSNDKERQLRFQTLVKEGKLEDLCLLIRTLAAKRREIEEKGKKFRATDERILREAEFQVYPEMEYVLNIDREAAAGRILENL